MKLKSSNPHPRGQLQAHPCYNLRITHPLLAVRALDRLLFPSDDDVGLPAGKLDKYEIGKHSMADPLSVAASLIAVVGLAWTSTQALHDAIDSWVGAPQTISNIKNELETLKAVLQALQRLFKDVQTPAVDSVLVDMKVRSVLQSCQDVCDDFKALVTKWTRHSTEGKFSKRDKLAVTFGGQMMAAFTQKLGLYKQTLGLVLQAATLYAIHVR